MTAQNFHEPKKKGGTNKKTTPTNIPNKTKIPQQITKHNNKNNKSPHKHTHKERDREPPKEQTTIQKQTQHYKQHLPNFLSPNWRSLDPKILKGTKIDHTTSNTTQKETNTDGATIKP